MNLDHIFLDISHVDRVITAIAVARTDRKGKKVIATFHESIADKDSLKTVIEGLKQNILDSKYGSTYVVVSHFAEFDRQLLKENGISDLFIGRAWIDPAQIAWPFVYHDLAGERTLESLCSYFGISNSNPDTATGNCEALVKLYWTMMNRYKIALTGEDILRDLGGDTLQKAFSFLGF